MYAGYQPYPSVVCSLFGDVTASNRRNISLVVSWENVKVDASHGRRADSCSKGDVLLMFSNCFCARMLVDIFSAFLPSIILVMAGIVALSFFPQILGLSALVSLVFSRGLFFLPNFVLLACFFFLPASWYGMEKLSSLSTVVVVSTTCVS